MNPAEGMLKFFEYKHLPPKLQDISREFHTVAQWMVTNLPPGPETTMGVRKLLEAKDCAVRAML